MKINVSDITYKPRKIQRGRAFEALKEDIKVNGLRLPILVNKDNEIIDGVYRYIACCELGYETIECKVHEGSMHVKDIMRKMSLESVDITQLVCNRLENIDWKFVAYLQANPSEWTSNPIIISKQYEILDGIHRYLAAQLLGYNHIQCLVK